MKTIIVGCGGIAETHIEALRKLGIEVLRAVGRDPDKTRAFAERLGIPEYGTDLAEALRSDADSVHICTPPTLRSEIVEAALAAGKHVICEKPLAMNAEEARSLADTAAGSGLVTALCCTARFYPAIMEASDIIRSGGIGKPLVLHGVYLQQFHAPPHEDGWRFHTEISGNQRAISEIGTHWIDLSYALTGIRISEVYADLGNWYPVRYLRDGMLTAEPGGDPVRVVTEDAAAVTMKFENGAIGSLILSEVSRGHFNDLSIEVSGSQGTLRWEEAEAGKLYKSDGGSMKAEETGGTDRAETFADMFREVYLAIGGKPHKAFPDFEDGAYIALVCEAIRRSGETGVQVRIDLHNKTVFR